MTYSMQYVLICSLQFQVRLVFPASNVTMGRKRGVLNQPKMCCLLFEWPLGQSFALSNIVRCSLHLLLVVDFHGKFFPICNMLLQRFKVNAPRNTHTRFRRHTQTFSISHTHIPTYSLSLSLSLTHTHTHKHTYTHTHSLSYTHTRANTHTSHRCLFLLRENIG